MKNIMIFSRLFSLKTSLKIGRFFINIYFVCFLFIILLIPPVQGRTQEILSVASFEAGKMGLWQEKSFHKRTIYSFNPIDGKIALKARSNRTASILYRDIDVNLQETPFLNWSWRVDDLLPGLDEQSKEGDDYSVRIYVVFKGNYFFSRPRSVNYVWSSSQPKGSTWPSAYTDKSMMLAVRSNKDKPGQWYFEKRNIRQDIKKIFGEEILEINMVAIMTDTDQSGLEATGWYGDIFFSNN